MKKGTTFVDRRIERENRTAEFPFLHESVLLGVA
jgi:hypothetical protein